MQYTHLMKQGQSVRTLYEDKYLMVVCKPEGLMTVPYEGYRGKTLISILEEQRRKRGLVHGSFRPQAVHRLDRDTSGVMMVALTPDIQKRVMDNWQTLITRRCYHALAELPRGPFPLEDEGIIDAPLIKNATHHSYVADHRSRPGKPQHDGKADYADKVEARDYISKLPNKADKVSKAAGSHEVSAITHYRVLSRNARYALLELELETGRTNQIRAHLAYMGCPIAGDTLYRAHTDPDHRMCLHACSLEFIHPVTGEKLSFEIPEPSQWQKLAK